MSKYKKVSIDSKEPVQYCGYYVLKVDNSMPKPDCLFVEIEEEEAGKQLKASAKQRTIDILKLISTASNFCEQMNDECGCILCELRQEIRKKYLEE